MAPIKHIEFMCSWCGRKIVKAQSFGRPDPGTCPRRPKDRAGKPKPHVWVVNRKF